MPSTSRGWLIGASVIWFFALGLGMSGSPPADRQGANKKDLRDPVQNAAAKVERGQRTFRFDTFGDEAFWGGTLKLHQAIEGSRFGGVGPGVSPRTALAVGLK